MENNKIIEDTIEKKFNQLITQIPTIINQNKIKDETDFFNFSLSEIYHNTLKTVIDIINEIMRIIDNSNNQDNLFITILNIFLKENRMFYLGIILIILSFVIYFIDGATI